MLHCKLPWPPVERDWWLSTHKSLRSLSTHTSRAVFFLPFAVETSVVFGAEARSFVKKLGVGEGGGYFCTSTEDMKSMRYLLHCQR